MRTVAWRIAGQRGEVRTNRLLTLSLLLIDFAQVFADGATAARLPGRRKVLLRHVEIAALERDPALGVPDLVQEQRVCQVLKAKTVQPDVAQLRLQRIDRRVGVFVGAIQLYVLFCQGIRDVVPDRKSGRQADGLLKLRHALVGLVGRDRSEEHT